MGVVEAVGRGEGRIREGAFLRPVPLAATTTSEEASCRACGGIQKPAGGRRGARSGERMPPNRLRGRRREGAEP